MHRPGRQGQPAEVQLRRLPGQPGPHQGPHPEPCRRSLHHRAVYFVGPAGLCGVHPGGDAGVHGRQRLLCHRRLHRDPRRQPDGGRHRHLYHPRRRRQRLPAGGAGHPGGPGALCGQRPEHHPHRRGHRRRERRRLQGTDLSGPRGLLHRRPRGCLPLPRP